MIEIALAVVLLVGSGLMIRTFQAMRRVDPGFVNPAQVVTMRVSIPESLIKDPVQTARTHEQIADAARADPGRHSVGLTSAVAMDGIGEHDPDLRRGLPGTRRQDSADPPVQDDRRQLFRDDGQPPGRRATR